MAADRLTVFQDGPYPCEENRRAIAFIEQALLELSNRSARVELEDAAKLKASGELEKSEDRSAGLPVIGD